MKTDNIVEVKFWDFFKFMKNKYDYILVPKEMKIEIGNSVKIITYFFYWKVPINLIREVYAINYNLIIKGVRSKNKMLIFI